MSEMMLPFTESVTTCKKETEREKDVEILSDTLTHDPIYTCLHEI